MDNLKNLCSNCNTEAEYFFRSRDYNRCITKERFFHYRCPKCNLIFISPIPGNLGKYYPQSYYFVPKSVDILEAGLANEKYKIEIIQRYIMQGRLLEIGPSVGCFTYLAKNSGFQVEAIEMDAKCSDFLNEVAGITTYNSNDICGVLKMAEAYNIIAMWHVIEHLPNPWETLVSICKKLNPGGILVIAAPNPDAFQFRVLGRYWPHVDAPRHLMLIPSRCLVEKIEALGMKVQLITTTDEGGLRWNVFGWEFFFSNLCSHTIINRFLRKVGRTVAKIFSPIERMNGKGSAYTLVFQKVA